MPSSKYSTSCKWFSSFFYSKSIKLVIRKSVVLWKSLLGPTTMDRDKKVYNKCLSNTGNIPATYCCYLYLQYGLNGVPTNIEEANKYYQKVRDNEFINFINNIIIQYLNKNNKNNEEDEDILNAKEKQYDAQKSQEQTDENHNVMNDNYSEESNHCYKPFPDKGNADSMSSYPVILDTGEGISTNKKESERYFKIATDKGAEYGIISSEIILKKGEGNSGNKMNWLLI